MWYSNVELPPWGGFIFALIAVLFFGTNFIPVKKVKAGDGMYFQWVMCCAIWMTSLVVLFATGEYHFHAEAMLGGFLWCSGNVLSLSAISYIGMGMGLLIWGSTNMLCGWASGFFGLFGIEKSSISNVPLNIAGVVIAVIALGIYMFVETEPTDGSNNTHVLSESLLEDSEAQTKPTTSKPSGNRQVIGATMAAVAGALFGFNFDPVEVAIAIHDDWPRYSVDYVFAHFTGIFFTSTIYWIGYLNWKALKNETPYIDPKSTLPAFICGTMWAIADISWFFANDSLQLAIAFPMITSGPGLVGALCGVFLFGEIKGKRNLWILTGACCSTVLAVTLIALSA